LKAENQYSGDNSGGIVVGAGFGWSLGTLKETSLPPAAPGEKPSSWRGSRLRSWL
jgi:hypothetical protein